MINLSKSEFVKSAPRKKDFLLDKPQVCFLGKSNVGKSSLINAICNNRKLVYVSKTPGHTKMLNYFLTDGRFYLVDAPGYGYFKDRSYDFETLMLDYFRSSGKCLKRAYLLLDVRRTITEDDFATMEILNQFGIAFTIVFTKADKLNQSMKAKAQNEIQKHLENFEVIMTSSTKKTGLDDLRRNISTALNSK
ncbi:MAG: ribosome biogenesis GTP-binding protein YihA/YsxC [Bacilli bacterium]